ncbi:MAG TPA: hypothetical protein VGI26_10925 [Solirubrobacteraceae bacterium]
MAQPAEARVWWADVEDVRSRIEHRREREREDRVNGLPTAFPAAQRGVREIRTGRRLTVASGATTAIRLPRDARRRPRRPVSQVVGPRPDRVAAWAVALGFLLVFAAVLSAHG